MVEWPEWWSWEIEFSAHLLKRMIDRRFNEVDLRLMLDAATGYYESGEIGRWVIATSHDGRAWEVVVEPLEQEQVLLVITAYSAE